MIPLLHDFAGETVLVLGGGRVGARKARRFAREARVVVVSPSFADDDFGGAQLVRAAPDPGDVERWVARTDPRLVVAATDDPALNDAAVAAAEARGALVNRADRSGDETEGVVVPATVRDGPVVVAVATGGESPALSRFLRQEIETEFEGIGAMARLSGDLRRALVARGVPPEDRRAAVRAVVRAGPVWKALRTGASKGRREADAVVRSTLDWGADADPLFESDRGGGPEEP